MNELFLTPGVKITEHQHGGQALQVGGTAAAAMIITAPKGPIGEYRFVSSPMEFARIYGMDLSLGHGALAANNFFRTGGERLYVVRTCHYGDISDAGSATATTASVNLDTGEEGEGQHEVWTLFLGTPTSGDTFRLTKNGAYTAELDAHDPVALDIQDALNALYDGQATVTDESPDYTFTIEFSMAVENSGLGADFGGITGGGDPTLTQTEEHSLVLGDLVTISASSPGTWGNDLRVEVSNVDAVAETFSLTVYEKRMDEGVEAWIVAERFETLTLDDTDESWFIEKVFADPYRGSTYLTAVAIEDSGVPEEGTKALTGGDNGLTNLDPDVDFVGSPVAENGLYALDQIDEVLGICIPGITAEAATIGGLNYVTTNVNRRPPQSDVFYYDLPLGLDPQEALAHVRDDVAMTTGYEGVYYPWVLGPTGDAEPTVPYVLGRIAQNDRLRGVWQAPAGASLPLPIRGMAWDVKESEQQVLNPRGINCIRHIPWEGNLIWGARTLKVHSRFRYLQVRRFVNVIKKTLFEGCQQFVFELNRPRTWARVQETAEMLLYYFYSMGAFGGASPDESFYARCDKTTNPPELIEQGILTCYIGIIPPKPAEMIHFPIMLYREGSLPDAGFAALLSS